MEIHDGTVVEIANKTRRTGPKLIAKGPPNTTKGPNTAAFDRSVQLPVHRNVAPVLARERVRWIINVSYFLFQHSNHSH
jgi:hypothetical protein